MIDLNKELRKKGIADSVEFNPCDLQKILSIEFHFNANQWMALLHPDYDFTSCCAIIIRIRDILFNCIKSEGEMSSDDFVELIGLIKHHECGEFKPPNHSVDHFLSVYEVIKDYLPKDRQPNKLNLQDPKECLYALSHYVDLYSFNTVFDNKRFTDLVNGQKALFDLMPALKALNDNFDKLNKTLTGFGIFQNNEICYSRSGIIVFETMKIAEEYCDYYKEDNFEIKKVTFSMEKGLEIHE